MEVQVKEIKGSWDLGFVLHKHTIKSECIGHNESGYPRFNTTRTEPGEALYQLKYQGDWKQVNSLAEQLRTTLLPLFDKIDLIVPMPASTERKKQPVNELANTLGQLTGIPVFENMVVKTPPPHGSKPLKDMHTREEKDAALAGRFSINQCIRDKVHGNALLLDDIFDTGATMNAACQALRTHPNINHVYVAAITWK